MKLQHAEFYAPMATRYMWRSLSSLNKWNKKKNKILTYLLIDYFFIKIKYNLILSFHFYFFLESMKLVVKTTNTIWRIASWEYSFFWIWKYFLKCITLNIFLFYILKCYNTIMNRMGLFILKYKIHFKIPECTFWTIFFYFKIQNLYS